MQNPYVGFALAAQLLDTTPSAAHDISPQASIADDVVLGKNVKIGAFAVIEQGVKLADDVEIGPGCFIGQQVEIVVQRGDKTNPLKITPSSRD